MTAEKTQHENLYRSYEQITEQHRHIEDLIAAVETAAGNGEGATTVDAVLTHLLRFMDSHFATEERMMADTCFKGLVEHTAEHRRCLAQLRAIIGPARAPRVADLRPATAYLRSWFAEHQLLEDREYREYIDSRYRG